MVIKRTVIIFTIVCVLLSFVAISCLSVKAIEPSKPGELWNRLVDLDSISGHKISSLVKTCYIRGIGEGILQTSGLINLSEIDKEGIVYNYGHFILKHIDEIKRIMDDLPQSYNKFQR